MSTRQDRDFGFDLWNARWDTTTDTNNIRHEGAALLESLGEYSQFNRSSIPLVRQPAPAPSSSAITVDHILRIAAQLDQETLLRSGNRAYKELLNEHNGTKEEFATLK